MRLAIAGVVLALVAYLSTLALWPSASAGLPTWLRWFGRPGSWQAIAVAAAVLAALCVLSFRTQRGNRSGNVPITVIAGLAATGAVLGFFSYWNCHDATHPVFITPLIWTASLVKGGISDIELSGHICPYPTPNALEVARLAALAAIFTGLGGVVIAVFRSQLDRLRVSLAGSVTAVVGIDDDTRSMISAVARTLDRRSTLVVITGGSDGPSEQEARIQGARVLSVDFNTPAALESLSLWRNLERLYLMSADPSTNLLWLSVISRRLAVVGSKHRLPLIVRIDDPWQAEAWRAQQFGGSDTRWAADAVGKYEVTARWLLDNIVAAKTIRHVFVCGTSQLTLALCADLTRRQLEYDYYVAPDEAALPALTLVGEDAEGYLHDHEFHCGQIGLVSSGPTIAATPEAPTVQTLMRLIGDGDAQNYAAIFVDDPAGRSPGSTTTGTRLAARFPAMAVYSWDPDARTSDDRLHIVGQLRTYRLRLDLPEGQAQDAWERAARLIHERYVAAIAPGSHQSPATSPWTQLDAFYRGSNRRQVRNALWMVERIAGHTWNTWGSPPTPLAARDMLGSPPLEQLAHLGFDRDTATKMARAEHEDWCRYYRRAGWKSGPSRHDARRIHDKLVDWSVIEGNPDLLNTALTSLAATLWSLRQLGYRSLPVWQPFTRVGTVIADQRNTPWTWASRSGETMRANAGDWAVQDDGESWSVRDDIFQATYELVGGRQWRRRGQVLARRAQPGETLKTLEGSVTAADGDWVVRGADGEQWPVPGDEFAQRYVEFHPPAKSEC
ncbi:hypothetical protein [Mycobacterium sp.]|uniref:hypothetical protein n=1 Tax=Mycobacterium sp. TaxID=1785 RepID=UPI003D6A9464